MVVKYLPIDGEEVSAAWYPLLWDIRHLDKVNFHVNEGHRTMARQAELVREKGLWSSLNPTGAAAPSANAPHILTGREDHAIDFDNASGVIAAAAHRGVLLSRTIPATEPWHVVPRLYDLKRYQRNRGKAIHKIRVRLCKARSRVRTARSSMRKTQGAVKRLTRYLKVRGA